MSKSKNANANANTPKKTVDLPKAGPRSAGYTGKKRDVRGSGFVLPEGQNARAAREARANFAASRKAAIEANRAAAVARFITQAEKASSLLSIKGYALTIAQQVIAAYPGAEARTAEDGSKVTKTAAAINSVLVGLPDAEKLRFFDDAGELKNGCVVHTGVKSAKWALTSAFALLKDEAAGATTSTTETALTPA